MEWLDKAPPVDGPRVLFDMYKSHLSKGGLTEPEAERQLDVVRQLHGVRPDARRVMFNNIYKSDKRAFTTQPNTLLMSAVEKRNPGRALDIGMGQGRNSVFLALKGWDVTGFDVSDEGIAIARKNAERAGVKLDALRVAEESFYYGSSQWDLVVFMYVSFPITSSTYVERLRRAMRPGAIIVIESLGEEEAAKNRPAVSIDPGRLLGAFKDFHVLHYEDVIAKPDWGRVERRLIRMVAERP